jgi:hypothetical protein
MAGYSSLWVGYKLFFQAMDLNVSKSGVYRIYPHGGFELITRESVKELKRNIKCLYKYDRKCFCICQYICMSESRQDIFAPHMADSDG